MNQKHKALPVKYDSSNSNELTLFNKNKNIHEYNCECNQSWDSWTNDSLESFLEQIINKSLVLELKTRVSQILFNSLFKIKHICLQLTVLQNYWSFWKVVHMTLCS